MDLQPLQEDDDAVRRFVEELWIPYHRNLQTTVDGHALAEDSAVVDEVVGFHHERLRSDDHWTWIAVDADTMGSPDVADGTSNLAGFISTSVDASPPVFDRPDRLDIDDLFVHERYRGTGLSRDLVRTAVEHARETGCPKLALDVHVDNERAVAF